MVRIHFHASTVLLCTASLCSLIMWGWMFPTSIFTMWVLGALMILTVGTGARYVATTDIDISRGWYLALLGALTLAPRLWWITHAATIPHADFAGYHIYALKVAAGNPMGYTPTMTVFPFKFFYPFVIGLAYWLTTPSPFVAELLNLMFSVIIAYQVYRLGTIAGGEHCGRLAGLFFALWPSQIAFTSVVAQEHMFEVFLLGAVLLLLRTHDTTLRKLVLFSLLAGGSVAIAHALRPVALVIFPTFVAYLIWGDRQTFATWRVRAASLAAAATGFAIVLMAIMVPASQAVRYPVWKSSAGFSLYVGTTASGRGFWTPESALIIRKHNYNFDSVHHACNQVALQNVVGDPLGFARLAAIKFFMFWGSDDYGLYSSTVEQYPTSSSVNIYQYRIHLNLLAHGAYAVILLCASIGMYRIQSHTSGKRLSWQTAVPDGRVLFIIQSVFLLHVVAFTFLEIQSRYHMLVIPMLMIPAAAAFVYRSPERMS